MSSIEHVISKEVSLRHRDNFWFQHFGAIPQWLKIESVIFHTLDQLCPDYHGGFWSFCTLSNQGAYLYPDLPEEKLLLINPHNGHEAQISPHAMGIVVCLLVFSLWSFKTESEVMCERFYQLRDFASQERKLQPMVLKNKTRQDLQKKFQELIEAYNLGAYTAEEFFNRLKEFINDLEHEEKRTVREGLTEEQLAVYDLMIQKTPLTDKERNKVKEIAKILTEKIQDILVIDWRKKQRTKARVKNMIEKVLDSLPDSYDDELWPQTCREVYMHIFEKYSGQEQSPYTN